MRTRRVRVRRRRSGRLLWVMSALMLLTALALHLWVPKVSDPVREETLSPASAVATMPPESEQRVTQEIQFPALERFLIQFGVYDSLDNARVEAARYVERGAAGYLLYDGRYRVIGAAYESREEADSVAGRLKEEEGIECYVYETGAGAVKLRVTAAPEQIDALVNAENALREQSLAFGNLAYQLDSGEIDEAQACIEISRCVQAITLARQSLLEVAGEKVNQVAQDLMDMMEKAEENLSKLSSFQEQTRLDLSSKIKYNYIEILEQHRGYLESLSV